MTKPITKPITKPPLLKQKNKPVIPDSLGGKKGFYIMLALLGGLILFVFKDFIFMNAVFLYKDIGSDSINIGWPQLFHISDYLHNMDGIPKWSYYQGMGQSYFGYLSGDPFDILIYCCKPENVVYMYGITEVLKFLTAGIFFYLFLRELKLTSYTAVIGAICFAFCGFMVLGSAWRMFSSEVYQTAFLLFSLEKLLNKKWYYFPFAIALISLTVCFNLFTYVLVSGIYVFIRLYNQYGWSKKIMNTYSQLAGLGILGVGMSAVIAVNKVLLFLDSPRVAGSGSSFSDLINMPLFQTDTLLDNLTKIGRLFSNDMLGTGNYFVGSENYMEAPLFYAGLISLLLFSQFFPFLSKKKKWIFGLLFACALLPFIFPYARYMFWLFSGKYYRGLSFVFSLLLLVYAMMSLHHIDSTRKINFKVLFGTFLFLLILLFYPNITNVKGLFQSSLQSFCLIFLILYTIVISLFAIKGAARFAKPMLIGLIFIELAFMANTTINKRDVLSYKEVIGKTGYNDYSVDAVQYIHQADTAFYRIQKSYSSGPAMHRSFNDPMIQRYYGTTSYSSFNQNKYVKFLLATVSQEHRFTTIWLDGLNADHPLLQIFGNIHYNLSKEPFPPQLSFFNDSIAKIGDVYVYKNKFRLPLGYTYNHYMPRSEFDKLNFKDVAFLKAVVIDDAEIQQYNSLQSFLSDQIESDYRFDHLIADVEGLNQHTLNITHFDQNNIKGEILLPEEKLLFFSIPFDKGWKAFDNGKAIEIKMVNIGFSGLLLGEGKHEIELRFEPTGYYLSIVVSLLSLLVTLLLIGWFYWGKQKFCSAQK